MKRLIFTVAIGLIAMPVLAQRLPKLATPESYTLTFRPDFSKNNFAGNETIRMHVLKATPEIVLNSAEIEIRQASINSGGVTQKAKVNFDKKNQTATLSVARPIPAGPAAVRLVYTGILNNDLRGFYLGKDEQNRKYAVTQFEATDARRAFPCFDEPAYKATFDITLVADKGMTAIANTRAVSDVPGPAGKHTVHFATTPKMSPYLVAMVVGHFEYIEGSEEGIPIRIISTPGKQKLAPFAMDVTRQTLRYLNRYFGLKYPYDKLDLIGLPDFAAGAMENTGLITFRDALLLLDEKHAPVDMKKRVAIVIAHEIAHQWFGDLVTMQWWDDVWLNEGFATWMESKPLEGWKPEWHLLLDNASDTIGVLDTDSLAHSRPIHQSAETPAQINELFDGIAYQKAAAVLKMTEAYLGEESFRSGVNAYIKEHAYGNATAADFWQALARASDKPVDKIMSGFVNQPGVPMISVKTSCAGDSTKVALAQQRYLYDRSLFKAGGGELWAVPVCVKAKSGAEEMKANCELLTGRESTFSISGCAPWVLANADAVGYYRSGYQPETVVSMAGNLESALSPAERIMLLSDVWAGVRVEQQTIADYMALAEGLQADRTNEVLEALIQRLEYIDEYLVNDADREPYHLWIRRLLMPVAADLGWKAKPGESSEQKALRSNLLYSLGYTARDPGAIAEGRKIASQFTKDATSVDHELISTALRIAAANENAALYDDILERVRSGKSTPEEYDLYLRTLTRFEDPKLLQRTLALSLSTDVRSQDSLLQIARVFQNPAGREIAWKFVEQHWSEIDKVGGGAVSGEVVDAAGAFCDAGMRHRVQNFFEQHPSPFAARTLELSLERINYCVDLKSQQQDHLQAWLAEHSSSGATAGVN